MATMYQDFLNQQQGMTPYTTRPAPLTSGMPGVLPATMPAQASIINPVTGLPYMPPQMAGQLPDTGTAPPPPANLPPPPDPRMPRPDAPPPYAMPQPFMRAAQQAGNPQLFDPYANAVNQGRQFFQPPPQDPNAPPPNRGLMPPWMQQGNMGGPQMGAQPEDPRDRMMRERFPRATAFHDTLMRRQMGQQQQPQQGPMPPRRPGY